MENMKVSIIIPVYKVEKYLRKCLDSVVNQTYRNIQIILVDDESPDGCGKICDEYAEKDERIEVIHQKNGGVSSARNTGLKHVSGDYVMFVDSDDYIDLCCVEKCVEAMTDDIDLLWFNYISEYPDKSKCPKEENDTVRVFTFDDTYDVFEYKWEVWGVLVRVGILKGITFDTTLTHGEDTLFIFEVMLKCRKVKHIYKNYYHYVQREDSAMQQGFDVIAEKKISVWKKIRGMLHSYPCLCDLLVASQCFDFINLINMADLSAEGKNSKYREFCRDFYVSNYKSIFKYCDSLTFKDKIKYFMFGRFFGLSEKLWIVQKKLRKIIKIINKKR